jgi:hypothetical protein
MYVSAASSPKMSCSVQELSVGHQPTADELRKFAEFKGVTICVTSDHHQPVATKALKEAGFIPLISYRNYASGHREGSYCTLWASARTPVDSPHYIPYETFHVFNEMTETEQRQTLQQMGVLTRDGKLKKKWRKTDDPTP